MAEVPTPFSDLLAGYGTVAIGDAMAIESVFALLKLRAEDGRPSWAVRLGGTRLTLEELLGTLDGLTTSIRQKLTGSWRGVIPQPSTGTPVPIPFSELLAGIETVGVVEEQLIESVFAVIKARNADGTPAWFVRSAEMKLSSEELLGALDGYTASIRQDVSGSWKW
ncbi:MAG: hypothetical protein QOE93_2541 [Actinomycetota bacterium]|nr:hypothetical protein [Actinomycetota bacterium]